MSIFHSLVHLPARISLNCLFTSSSDFEMSNLDAFFLTELSNLENLSCRSKNLSSVCDVMLVPYSQDAVAISFFCCAITRLYSAKNCSGVSFWPKTAEKANKTANALRIALLAMMPALQSDAISALKSVGERNSFLKFIQVVEKLSRL